MTLDEKLDALEKAWGYVEVSRVTIVISGWHTWLVKNYKGKPISKMGDKGLPSNPNATTKIEYSGGDRNRVINNAYRSMIFKAQKAESKKSAA